MISRLLRSGTKWFVYFCLATVLAQVALAGYFTATWGVDRDKAIKILAVLQDVDLYELRKEAEDELQTTTAEQPSYEAVIDARAKDVLDVQLRLEALATGMEQLAYEQRKLRAEKERFEGIKANFDRQLIAMQEGAAATGVENFRVTLESLKADEAKIQLVKMLEDNDIDQEERLNIAVVVLSSMTTVKASKIMAEFKTDAELTQLYEVLKRMRQGEPENGMQEKTLEQLQGASPPVS